MDWIQTIRDNARKHWYMWDNICREIKALPEDSHLWGEMDPDMDPIKARHDFISATKERILGQEECKRLGREYCNCYLCDTEYQIYIAAACRICPLSLYQPQTGCSSDDALYRRMLLAGSQETMLKYAEKIRDATKRTAFECIPPQRLQKHQRRVQNAKRTVKSSILHRIAWNVGEENVNAVICYMKNMAIQVYESIREPRLMTIEELQGGEK